MLSALSRDGARVLTLVTADSAARVWNSANGALLAILEGHTDSVLSAAFTSDGRRVVTASADGTARIWDLRPDLSLDSITTGTSTNELVADIRGRPAHRERQFGRRSRRVDDRPERCRQARRQAGAWSPPLFSADGRRVLAACEGNMARLWDADTGATLTEYRGHEDAVRSVALSPDGALVATGSDDRPCVLWDSATGAQRHVLVGHKAGVGTVQFSPDGQRIVSSGVGVSDDETIGDWCGRPTAPCRRNSREPWRSSRRARSLETAA